jgi:8-oxo-dGTP pyrophosphatase MutT (NUDIX family)
VTESAEAPRRLAAVVIPIFADAPPEVVFVARATHLRRHAGQIAFPGGALDEADGGDLARAGLRELHEEIGIAAGAVSIVGQLRSFRQTRNVFTVTPFVGVVQPGTPLVVDLNEASAAYRVPLAAILEPGAVRPGVTVSGDRRIETPVFDYAGMHVWGLTGNILEAFIARYRQPDSELRAALEARFV